MNLTFLIITLFVIAAIVVAFLLAVSVAYRQGVNDGANKAIEAFVEKLQDMQERSGDE